MGKNNTKVSAGLLMYKQQNDGLRLFIVHPGGPFFARRDDGWWTIPKGLAEKDENLLQTAQREFQEETGMLPVPPFYSLGEVKQKGSKVVHGWAFSGDWDKSMELQCNTFIMEWPPHSGKKQSFPEVDQALWVDKETALRKINEAQRAFIHRLSDILLHDANLPDR